jgi:hypothetical protein
MELIGVVTVMKTLVTKIMRLIKMTFEEQFPSFKEGYNMSPKILMISREAVMVHCLDKQKVREEINKHLGCKNHHFCQVTANNIPCNLTIFRELGL